MTRKQFDALWARWDENGNGRFDAAEISKHSMEVAHLVGDPAFEDPEVLLEFLETFYDGRAEGSNRDRQIDREELWAMLQEAAA